MEPPRRVGFVSGSLPKSIDKVVVLDDGVRVAIAVHKWVFDGHHRQYWKVQVWNTSDLRCLCVKLPITVMLSDWDFENDSRMHMAAVPGNMLAFSQDDSLVVLEMTTYTVIWEVRFGINFCGLTTTPEGHIAAAADKSVVAWYPTSKQYFSKTNVSSDIQSIVGLPGNRVAVGTNYGRFEVINLVTRATLHVITLPLQESVFIDDLILFDAHRVIATARPHLGDCKASVSMWNFETGEQVQYDGPITSGAVVLSDGTLVCNSGRSLTHCRYDAPESVSIGLRTKETYCYLVPLKECKLAVFGNSKRTFEVLDFQDRRPLRIARQMALKFLALQAIPRDVLSLIDDFAGNLV